ncbi:MAG: T9SS type A sorting domain-containing protein [candidate division Zixibacteria bacterium]|nr:T9SS type A sorting domain-containing protein [candidate division Zixibacteria bacterium]
MKEQNKMKRFALITCLAACLVFALGAIAFGADRIEVEDAGAGTNASLTVGVFTENDGIVNTIVLPLVVRSLSNGAYPTTIQGEYNDQGRMPYNGSVLTQIVILNSYQLEDGTCKGGDPGGFFTLRHTLDSLPPSYITDVPEPSDPDALLATRGKILSGELTAGSDFGGEPFLFLNFTNPADTGCYIVDTTCTNPANHLSYNIPGGLVILPAFETGTICALPNLCPENVTAATDPVGATVGSQASNTITATDPETPPDPIEFYLVSGPGSVDLGGNWTWTPTCADVGTHTVVVEATDKGEGSCPNSTVSFTVEVSPTPLQISCSNVSVLWSAADAAQTVGLTGGCPPYNFTADLGTIDGNGDWSYDHGCGDLGTTPVNIDVTDDAGQQISCQFNLEVTNTAPTCQGLPATQAPVNQAFSLQLGPAVDADGDALTYSFDGPAPSWVSINGNFLEGTRPDTALNPETVCWTVSDGCETSSSQCCVELLSIEPCLFEIVGMNEVDDPSLGYGDLGDIVNYSTTLGDRTKTVWLNSNWNFGDLGLIGGFDFLICYDATGLTFQNAERTPNLEFEYFTWRTGMFGGNCGGACPDGFIRLVGIADMNNGAEPPASAFEPSGLLVALDFYVTADQNFTGSCLHVGFCSYDCGDNVVSSATGDTLWVFDDGAETNADWSYSLDSLIAYCMENPQPDKPTAMVPPVGVLCPGAICIVPPPDDRGDMNLNGIANEIGDAVLYSQYFIIGIDALSDNAGEREVQIFASDVNNDGITLTVADLVYLIRIITGDAQPFDDENVNPKVAPYANSVDVLTETTGGAATLTTDASVELGGAVLTYRYSDLTIGEPITVDGMTVKARASHGELRVLIAPDAATGGKIPVGTNDLLTIPVEGDGTIELVESQFADANGALLEVDAAAKLVPTSYALHQNYPNPFNAGTVIPVTLKDASNYTLTIYNVAGQVVKTYSGNAEAGTVNIRWDGRSNSGSEVASGMYFYRIDTPSFTDTRKMVVLK